MPDRARIGAMRALIAFATITLLVAPIAASAQFHDRRVLTTDSVPGIGVRFTSRMEHYDVFGTSLPTLRRDMGAKAVATRGGGRHTARTTWDLRWRYASSRETAFGCVPVGVQVFLDVVVTFPRWQDSTRAESDSLREEWGRFTKVLLEHEANHADIAIGAVNRLSQNLRRVRAPVCPALYGEMLQVGQRSTDEMRASNENYDRSTMHGRTEGAVLGRPSVQDDPGTR